MNEIINRRETESQEFMRLILILFVCLHKVTSSYLSQKIDVNYDKRMSPYYITKKAVDVTIEVPFMLLVDIVENEQRASWVYTLNVRWQDDRLKFNRSQFNNESLIHIPMTEVWIPRQVVYNSLETRKLVDDSYNDVSIDEEGFVVMKQLQYSDCICAMHTERFPFDTQFCPLAITSPSHTVEYLNLIGSQDGRPAMMKGNAEFEYQNFSIWVDDYMIGNDSVREIMFVVHLDRRPLYYIIIIVIPTIIISSITITGTMLPIGDGDMDTIGVGLASLMALTFSLSIVADSLPKSENLPLLGFFLLGCIFICTTVIIIGILLNCVKSKCRKSHMRPPFWLQMITCSGTKELQVTTSEKLEKKGCQSPDGKVFNPRKSADGCYLEWRVAIRRIHFIFFFFFQLLLFLIVFVFFSFSWMPRIERPMLLI